MIRYRLFTGETPISEVLDVAAHRIDRIVSEEARSRGISPASITVQLVIAESTPTEDWTKAEIVDYANAIGLAPSSRLTKAELLEAIREGETEVESIDPGEVAG